MAKVVSGGNPHPVSTTLVMGSMIDIMAACMRLNHNLRWVLGCEDDGMRAYLQL